jgi:release factor glutamine methyltransferase
MKVKEALAWAQKQLSNCNIKESIRESRLICAHILSCSYGGLLLQQDEMLLPAQKNELEEIVEKRCQMQPLQYILGSQEFMSLDFVVNPAVLIPRWDTERVTDVANNLLRPIKKPLIADVCCGSGAIGIALAYYLPQAKVYLCDISNEALAVCRQNVIKHSLQNRCSIHQGDLAEPLLAEGLRVDLLISNPPYVKDADMETLPPDVLCEPRLALAGGKDGLDFYRRLIKQAPAVLRPGGYFVLEIGYDQKEAVQDLLAAAGFIVRQVVKDYSGHNRGLVSVYR